MRKYATGWMIKGIFGLIIIVFIFWGVGGMKGDEKTVAEVGSHKVTMAEYQEARTRLLNMYRNVFKDKLDENMLKALKLNQAAMNEIVDSYLLLQHAKTMGITVSDAEFRTHLNNIEAFKRDGKFNKTVYQEVLKASGIEPGRFEESEKSSMVGAKMMNIIRDNGAVLSDDKIYKAYVKEKGKVDLAYTVFDPSDYLKKVTVSDKEAEDLYEKEKGTHFGENQYRLKYITVAEKGPVKDDAVYMDMLKVKDIDKYGKEKGFTVTDLGTMRTSEVRERLKGLGSEQWLKELKKGDISLPVRADGKSYIFQLVDFEAGKPVDKPTVIKEIKERVLHEKAKGLARAEAAKAIAAKSPDSKKETGFVPRNSPALPGIGMIPKEDFGVLALTKDHDLYDKPVDMGGKYFVFSLKDERAPEKEEWEKDKVAFKQYLVKRTQDEFYKSFITELRKKSKVKIDWKEIAVTESD
jgi:parvulin-like peptidyl-prolyl isomerase